MDSSADRDLPLPLANDQTNSLVIDRRSTDDDRDIRARITCNSSGTVIVEIDVTDQADKLTGRVDASLHLDDLEAVSAVLIGLLRAVTITADTTPASTYIDQVRLVHPNAYTPWTPQQEATLIERQDAGASITTLAQELGRQPSAIRTRLRTLSRRPNEDPSPTPSPVGDISDWI